jgi:adenylate kinase
VHHVRIVVIGPPGAGKGTYASYFSRKYCIPHISTGDIFRAEVQKGTELGRRIKEYMDRGELVPDDIVIEVVRRRLSQPDTSRGFILDGYPRTLRQAEALDEFARIDAAVYIYAPLEVVIDRLSKRYVCPVCGRVYNLDFNPPKNDLRCDYDGAKLVRRSDDEPEVIKRRYEVYYKQTQPVIDYYREKNLLIEIDNSGSAEIGVRILEKILRERGILKLEPCRPDVSVRGG